MLLFSHGLVAKKEIGSESICNKIFYDFYLVINVHGLITSISASISFGHYPVKSFLYHEFLVWLTECMLVACIRMWRCSLRCCSIA